MGLFSRLGDIVNSNLNVMIDRAEEPDKMIRLMVQEMEDTLVEVRSSAARTIAEKKDIMRQIEGLETAQAEWQRKAELALSKDREDLAKGALLARGKAAETVDVMRRELVTLEQALAKTNDDLSQLQAKLSEAKAKQKALELRRKTATDRLRVRTQLHDGRIDAALDRYATIERKLDELEGKVESFDLGEHKSLADEIAALEAEAAIEEELAQLKARLAARGP